MYVSPLVRARSKANWLQLAESATHPSTAFPKQEEDPYDNLNLYLALGAVTCAVASAIFIWKRNSSSA
jgi:Ras family protein T1